MTFTESQKSFILKNKENVIVSKKQSQLKNCVIHCMHNTTHNSWWSLAVVSELWYYDIPQRTEVIKPTMRHKELPGSLWSLNSSLHDYIQLLWQAGICNDISWDGLVWKDKLVIVYSESWESHWWLVQLLVTWMTRGETTVTVDALGPRWIDCTVMIDRVNRDSKLGAISTYRCIIRCKE